MPKSNVDNSILSYLAVAGKDDVVLPAMLSSMFEKADDKEENAVVVRMERCCQRGRSSVKDEGKGVSNISLSKLPSHILCL